MPARLLLVNPPVVRPCEPPAGIVRLATALRAAGVEVELIDLNLEAQLGLLGQPPVATDTWTRRAGRDAPGHLDKLRNGAAFANIDTYIRVVGDLERLLAKIRDGAGWRLGLANVEHATWSATRSVDLLAAAESSQANPCYPSFRARLAQVLSERAPTHVGLSLNYLSQALTAFAILGWLRREAPMVRRVVGGGLATSWLRQPGWVDRFAGLVDQWVAGPGEDALVSMLTSDAGDAGPGGAAAARDCRDQAHRKIILPDYHLLATDTYLSPGRVLPISASSGCFWRRCAFCPEQAEGNAYVALDPRQTAMALRASVASHRPALVHLLDNALSPTLLRALVQDPPGAPWYGFARFGPPLSDPGFAKALRASGCAMLQLGLESGDPRVLEAMHKGIDLGDAATTLDSLHAAGVGTYVYLLFGTPAEDLEAAGRTLQFVREHAAAIDYLNVAIFNLPAHGQEAADLTTRPFNDGDLSLYLDFDHPRGWDRRTARTWIGDVFSRDERISEILLRDPPVFTSSHAPFFLSRRR